MPFGLRPTLRARLRFHKQLYGVTLLISSVSQSPLYFSSRGSPYYFFFFFLTSQLESWGFMCPALPHTFYEYAHLGPSSGKTERTKAMGFTTSSWDHSSSDCTRRFPFLRILGVCGFATATVVAADTLRLFESWCARKHRKREWSIFLIFAGH